MITVAHVDHSREYGGAELALARLLEVAPGWTPRLFLPPGDSESSAFAGVPTDFLHELGIEQPAGAIGSGGKGQLNLLARVLYQAALLRASSAFRQSQVVHANTSRAAVIARLACLATGKPLVVHLRDAIDEAALGGRNTRLLVKVISGAAGVIANSDFTLKTARPYIHSGTPTCVIPSPIGLTDQRHPVEPAEQVATVGMLARITEWKGQELLIRAFAAEFRGSRITLELAGAPAFGQNNYLDYLYNLVEELGITSQIRFLGHVSDVWSLLDTWDICVHASLHEEPLGQNVLQYLAACRPTVAANAGGPAEWIQHGKTGLLFEQNNQPQLAATLRRLVDNRKLRTRLSATLTAENPVPTDADIRAMHQSFFEQVWASAGS